MAPTFKLPIGRPWLLFVGENYYPSGGVSDFLRAFRTMRKAFDALRKTEPSRHGSWAQVVCAETGERHDFEYPWKAGDSHGAWVEVKPRDRFRPCDETEDDA